MATHLHYSWKKRAKRETFKTGVSLHGHSWYSKENLGFFPDFAKKVTPFARLLARAERDHKKKWGAPINWSRAYWTSPVSPEAALALEEAQLTRQDLLPLVALSDHDEIAANHELIKVHKKNVPVSLEWTVPYGGKVFHVGVHNLPPAQSAETLGALRAWTAAPDERTLRDLFAHLHGMPEVLIVLNHPFTDQGRIGHEIPEPLVKDFLARYGAWIHAVEANALQSWETNRRVLLLGEATGLPVVSGGDRHGFEPNGMVNLTNAATFAEFVREVRDRKMSDILLLPQSRTSLVVRYVNQANEIVAPHPELGPRTHWHDRVFYVMADGVTRSLTELSAPDSPALAAINRYLKLMDLLVASFVNPISPIFARTKESDIS